MLPTILASGLRYHSIPRTARALARCLSGPAQPQPARQEAAESLDALIAALTDPDPRIRFWAAFGLNRSRGEARAVSALEAVLDDSAVPPGYWWSVGREALATLAALPISYNPHQQHLAAEAQAILANPNRRPPVLHLRQSPTVKYRLPPYSSLIFKLKSFTHSGTPASLTSHRRHQNMSIFLEYYDSCLVCLHPSKTPCNSELSSDI